MQQELVVCYHKLEIAWGKLQRQNQTDAGLWKGFARLPSFPTPGAEATKIG